MQRFQVTVGVQFFLVLLDVTQVTGRTAETAADAIAVADAVLLMCFGISGCRR